MTNASFEPIIYMKKGCPFCMKVRIFLLEAGLQDKVQIREFSPGTEEEQGIRTELAPHFEKITFPTALMAPDHYSNESDAIINHFAEQTQNSQLVMPTYRAYADDLMPILFGIYKENMDLKNKLAS